MQIRDWRIIKKSPVISLASSDLIIIIQPDIVMRSPSHIHGWLMNGLFSMEQTDIISISIEKTKKSMTVRCFLRILCIWLMVFFLCKYVSGITADI